MLEIKQARPRETYNAVYVTKKNVDEFRKLAYKCDPISVDEFDNITIYRYNGFSLIFHHDCWYTEDIDPDNMGWQCQEDFDECYEIV